MPSPRRLADSDCWSCTWWCEGRAAGNRGSHAKLGRSWQPDSRSRIGSISERDRLPTSADTLSVTRPTTGSKTRSKGVLFVLVGSTVPGPRTREATKLVADTIRHEYYYDESAGVPVCLEKAIKSADRRLRSSREGAGLPPGSLGVAAAVIRNNELYLATLGAAEAYLVRAARLLMPDRSAARGPAQRRGPLGRRVARRDLRRRRPGRGVTQRDRDGRHRGAQERRADAASAGRGGAPPPPVRGFRRCRLGQHHRRRGQGADEPPPRPRRRRQPPTPTGTCPRQGRRPSARRP